MKNIWLSLGYNYGGFEDRDFSEARYTNSGIFFKFRMKFDEHTFNLASDKQKELLKQKCEVVKLDLPKEVNDNLWFSFSCFDILTK